MSRSDERLRERLGGLEREARERPGVHVARLLAVGLVGYFYPALLLVGALGIVGVLIVVLPAVWDAAVDRLMVVYFVALGAALVLVGVILRAFYVALPEPAGLALRAGEARPLREMIEEVRRGLGAPGVDKIYLDWRLNAAAMQRPRFGFWGPRTNYVIVGVPLLMALRPGEVRAVIAHELGHLRGRHNAFSAWIYRIEQTWEGVASTLKEGVLRRAVIGWFVRWYGPYLSETTLAKRRLHEYEADRRCAELAGVETAGAALAGLAWADYRLGRDFWPALRREAGREPLPPGDVLARMAAFLGAAPEDGAAQRWRRREGLSRTPVTSEHPCLVDRLRAIGAEAALGRTGAAIAPEESAVALLGETRKRVWEVTNASWKVTVIEQWRREHAAAKHEREQAEKRKAQAAAEGGPPAGAGANGKPGDREWQAVREAAEYGAPAAALGVLGDFLGRFPEHAAANFAMARVMLERDDERAAAHFERAMRGDSELIGPSLFMLLNYYRETGRDAEADPLRRRLDEHTRAVSAARRERQRVGRGDRFEPHDLPAGQVEQVRRVLSRYPQVTAGFLARKKVRMFEDKSSYVLALACRGRPLEDRRRAERFLAACVTQEIEAACTAVVLARLPRGARQRLLRAAGAAVYQV